MILMPTPTSRVAPLLLLFLIALLSACATPSGLKEPRPGPTAKLDKLGTVEFPITCSSQAQNHFLRGATALHSFWYPVALEEFRAVTQTDPDCMMGYWGEAMAHNHPIWGDPQETNAARKVLEKIKITPELTARERAYLQAVQILYGTGDKAGRDKAYASAMEKIYRAHPDDSEAALFYALALMGSTPQEHAAALQTRLRAGAIAEEVFKKKPNHPGAVHYVIHAYDDPKNAHRALEAARRYAEIAPAAPHALHMPAHIFLQLGMWPEAAASNEASWAASDRWVKARNRPVSERDYHSLHWLLYAYLQQGRFDKAEELLEVMRASFAEFPRDDPRNLAYGAYTLSSMAAIYLVETQQWDLEKILGSAQDSDPTKKSPGSGPDPYQAFAMLARSPAIFARGLAAAMNGSPRAQESIAALQAISQQKMKAPVPFVSELREAARIQALEIAAVAQATRGDLNAAIKTMEKAAAIVDPMPPPSGPPPLIKPVHELFGEVLLRTGRSKQAAEEFEKSLTRHPKRARSLLGMARALNRSGDAQAAGKFYAQVAAQWQKAGAQSQELREARNHGKAG